MNHDDTRDEHPDEHPDDRTASPAAELGDPLRWQLRALRREVAPSRDLWPGIAARLAAGPAAAAARPTPRPTRAWRRLSLATAAGLLLAAGAVVWLARTAAPVRTPSLVQREADGLTRQYRGALRELTAAPVPAELQPTLAALDRDAAAIRAALTRDPDSLLLLEQLRRTYAHRLALAQRLVRPDASA